MIAWPGVLGRRRTLPLSGDPARVPPDGLPGPVDVVIPVYGAAAELDACLASVLAHTDLSRHRLVLVVDGPQEPVRPTAAVEPDQPPVVQEIDDGFNWGSAAIGAGATGALVVIVALGGVAYTTRHRIGVAR